MTTHFQPGQATGPQLVTQAMLHWHARYVGQPWRKDAEGPDAWDCKGLVRHVQRVHYGREVPRLLHVGQLTDWAEVRASAEREGWCRISIDIEHPARDGDILVLKGASGTHVGVLIRPSRRLMVLHAYGSEAEPGAVRCDELRELLAAGAYSRPEFWRYLPGFAA